MVEIVDRPPKKLSVGERIFYSTPADLASLVGVAAASGHPVALSWAEGIVFIASPAHPDSELMVEKYLEGEMHWASIQYSVMEKFQDKLKVGGIEIPIVDVSRSELVRQVAVWLKSKVP